MLRNYLVMAYRNFLRQKVYSSINIFGLAIGLTGAIFIFLYVHDELSYDSIHPDTANTYRLGVAYDDGKGDAGTSETVPGGWASALQERLPEVKATYRSIFQGFPTSVINHEDDRIFLSKDGTLFWVTPDIDQVLYYHLIRGNTKQALQEPNSIVISETAASRLFGDSDPIDRTLGIKHLITNNKEITVQVTGVFKDFPSNSHYRPEYLISMASLSSSFIEQGHTLDEVTNRNNLNSMFMSSYVVLKDGASTENLERELNRLTEELLKTDSTALSEGYKTSPIFRNIKDLHFDKDVAWELEGMGNWTYVLVLSSIAILILLIATINYMNLATARANKRSMEVGLRKTFGGVRSQLAGQFLFESFIMTFIAFMVAFMMVLLLLPYFNQLAHKSFTAISLFNPIMLLIVLGVVLFAGFVGGSYPALILSSFKPVDVLKGTFSKGKGGNLFRNALVTVQFFISILLVITTLVIVNQLSLMRDSKLNEYGDQMLCIRYNNTAPPRLYKPLKTAIQEDPEILITTGPDLPRLEYFGNAGIMFRFPDVRAEAYEFRQIAVDYNFPRVFGFDVLSGRYFIEDTAADSSAVILNESAVKALNMTNEHVLGQGMLGQNGRALNVIGVVRDFPFRPINFPIDPLVIRVRSNAGAGIVYIKLPAGKIKEKIAFIEQTWKRVLPGIGLDYWFMDEQFDRMYASEVTISALTVNLAVLSLVITILGVAGFSSYTADRRTREIGIRKVLGASAPQMVSMLLMSFIKIFLLASVIAIPVAYWMADRWLTNFVYRTPLSIALFIFSVGVLALITLLTVSFETMRAAGINPVKAIKHD